MKFRKLFLCGILVSPLLAGCSPSRADYTATLEHGLKTVPHVDEIRRLFPSSITVHYTSAAVGSDYHSGQSELWNTEVYFGQRYVLRYIITVIPDYRTKTIARVVGNPKFILLEVNRISDSSRDIVGADFEGERRFDEASWNKVVSAGGDFSVIGISIKTNSPVPRFGDYMRASVTNRELIENLNP